LGRLARQTFQRFAVTQFLYAAPLGKAID
jgi:hypothetical protein